MIRLAPIQEITGRREKKLFGGEQVPKVFCGVGMLDLDCSSGHNSHKTTFILWCNKVHRKCFDVVLATIGHANDPPSLLHTLFSQRIHWGLNAPALALSGRLRRKSVAIPWIEHCLAYVRKVHNLTS